jgi:hypothetical protein
MFWLVGWEVRRRAGELNPVDDFHTVDDLRLA